MAIWEEDLPAFHTFCGISAEDGHVFEGMMTQISKLGI